MKKIMIRAWEIYRKLEGDHRAKLALALIQAWSESRESSETPEEIIEKLQTWSCFRYKESLCYGWH